MRISFLLLTDITLSKNPIHRAARYPEQLRARWDTLRIWRWTAPTKEHFDRAEQFGVLGTDDISRAFVTNWLSDKRRMEQLLRVANISVHPLVHGFVDSHYPEAVTQIAKYHQSLPEESPT